MLLQISIHLFKSKMMFQEIRIYLYLQLLLSNFNFKEHFSIIYLDNLCIKLRCYRPYKIASIQGTSKRFVINQKS